MAYVTAYVSVENDCRTISSRIIFGRCN